MPQLGTATVYRSILPNFNALWRIARNSKLSTTAKHRLKVIDYYYNKSKKNVSLTARHFGTSRSYVHKWLKRFNPKCLLSLESHSTRPKHIRTAIYDAATVIIIRKIRREYPAFSSFKIAVILQRDYDITMSPATVGRIIKKYNLFFSRRVKLHQKLSRSRKRVVKRKREIDRLCYHLQTAEPTRIIEFDLKHIVNYDGRKQYAFCAIDPVTKQAVIHIASNAKSATAKIAIEEVLAKFGQDILIVCDNGSENFKDVYDLLKALGVPQLFARPHTPKDKPHIENFIGKYQKECLDESFGDNFTVAQRQDEADRWLRDWHFYRPHQALGYYTPAEFCDIMGITTIYEVSTM